MGPGTFDINCDMGESFGNWRLGNDELVLPLYWPGRELFASRASAHGFRVCSEAYPDLDYDDDGSLVVEREKRPVELSLIYQRMVEIIGKKTLTNRNGKQLPMNVETACIHGDSPNALAVVAAKRKAVADCGLEVACATAKSMGNR